MAIFSEKCSGSVEMCCKMMFYVDLKNKSFKSLGMINNVRINQEKFINPFSTSPRDLLEAIRFSMRISDEIIKTNFSRAKLYPFNSMKWRSWLALLY